MKNQILLSFILLIPFCAYGEPVVGDAAESEDSYWQKVKEAYEAIRSGDVKITEEAKRLVKEDVERIGDWEYKILKLEAADEQSLEEKLNELGDERWECFYVRDLPGGGVQFYFKKRKISYLQGASKADIMRMFAK